MSNQHHFDYLDGWRGLAIIFLLIGHFYPVPGINLGTLGVNLFFVLSGLLMSRLLFVKQVPIPLFYRRRIARIFPAFFVMLTAIVLIFSALGREINWSEVAMAVLFLNNYFPGDIGHAVMPFGHIWSLSVEEHAYILLSLLAVISRRMNISAVWLVGFFSCCFALTGVWYWSQLSGKELDFGVWPHSEVSAYGIFISAFFLLLLKNRKIPTLPILVYPILILVAMMLHWWSVPNPVRTIFGVGLFALTINILGSAPQLVKSFLSIQPLRKIGLWSFSIYLWQQPFYYAHHRDGLPAWVAVSLAILTGIVSFYCVEQPIRRYLNSHWGQVSQDQKIVNT